MQNPALYVHCSTHCILCETSDIYSIHNKNLLALSVILSHFISKDFNKESRWSEELLHEGATNNGEVAKIVQGSMVKMSEH